MNHRIAIVGVGSAAFRSFALPTGILLELEAPMFDPRMFEMEIRLASHIYEHSYREPNPNARRENNCHHTPFYRGLRKYKTRHKR